MKLVLRNVVLGGALLIAAAAPIAAQVPQSTVSSVFVDLIKKGKNDLDNFDYSAAANVWQQLLAQPLSRQQRIDVLQLLAATMFPNDAGEQKRDSASSVIRQLVGMGVRRMVVKDVSHPGLDSLYNAVVASAGPSAAPAAFDSVRNVVALVTEGYQLDEIADRVNIDCYTFAFDELETGLRRSRVATTLPIALKRTCSQLLVESDPANTNLTVGSRDFGNVPDRGQLRWVMPERSIELAVARGQSRVAKVVEFPQGKLLQARFFLPKDTLLWPAVKTPQQVAEDLRIFDRFAPSTPKPVQPVKPSSMGAFATGMLWGLVGGAAGFAVGQFLPVAGCTVNETVPAGRTARVKGKTYNAGETINLGGGMPCVATVAGGAGAGMFLFTATMKGSKNRSRTARYNEAARTYPTVLKEWDERERRQFAERNPDVRQTLSDQQTKLQQAQAENAIIRARNANLPQPEINVRELSFAQTFGAGTMNPTTPEINSDVDMRVPAAGVSNPDAVAIVIGNRDYQVAGVPKADLAIRDAKSMKRYLVEAFGFSEDRVILDTNVSHGRMNELFGSSGDAGSSRLAELVAAKPAGSVDVFVFYSGHGGPDGRPAKRFLLPSDANPRRLTVTGYALDVLYKNLTALRARSVTVAIDAGFGSLSDAGSLISNQSFGGAIELEVGTVGGANTQVFLAGTADQTAKWRRDQGHGLFTYFFLKGIQGSADANGDRTVTAGELEAYVKSNVRSYASERMSGATQSPEVFTNNPGRPVVTIK